MAWPFFLWEKGATINKHDLPTVRLCQADTQAEVAQIRHRHRPKTLAAGSRSDWDALSLQSWVPV